MKHVVLRSFHWCPDGSGVTREALDVGDERDFGWLAAGLVRDGLVAPIVESEFTIQPAAEEIEFAVNRGKRKRG
jgi:hypothetical protein